MAVSGSGSPCPENTPGTDLAVGVDDALSVDGDGDDDDEEHRQDGHRQHHLHPHLLPPPAPSVRRDGSVECVDHILLRIQSVDRQPYDFKTYICFLSTVAFFLNMPACACRSSVARCGASVGAKGTGREGKKRGGQPRMITQP